jgi:hypothetical protein
MPGKMGQYKSNRKPMKKAVKKPKDGHKGGKKQMMQYGKKMMEFGKKMMQYGKKM